MASQAGSDGLSTRNSLPSRKHTVISERPQQQLGRWDALLGSRAGLIAAGVAILAIGVCARLALLTVLRYAPQIEIAEMEQLAMNLAESGTLGNPYRVPTGPSAHHAPVYPTLLAAIFHLWGYGSTAAWAMVLMNVTFASLQYALLPLLARIARLRIVPAVAAALVGAAVPFRVLTEARWETTLAALVAVLAVMVSLWWGRNGLPSHGRAVAVGAAWGVALLTAPSLLPVFLLIVLWQALSSSLAHWRPRLSRLALLLTAAAVVLAPWTVRNYRALGGLVFVRSNFGIEFSVSNHDAAYVMAKDNNLIGLPHNYFHQNHPFSSRAHALRVQRVGEIAYNRERLAHALAWCRARWERFMELTRGRFWTFWVMPTRTQPWKDALLQPVTVLGLAGLAIVWRRDRRVGAVFLAVLLGYPLVYYLVQTDSRYRYPVDWVLLLLASYSAAAVAARLHVGRAPDTPSRSPTPNENIPSIG